MPTRPPTLVVAPAPTPAYSRPAPCRRGYGRAWRAARLLKLGADPCCQDCAGRGLVVAATEVDHVTALSRGGTHDPDNLRSLCKSCHSKKTAAVDGGLGRGRG